MRTILKHHKTIVCTVSTVIFWTSIFMCNSSVQHAASKNQPAWQAYNISGSWAYAHTFSRLWCHKRTWYSTLKISKLHTNWYTFSRMNRTSSSMSCSLNLHVNALRATSTCSTHQEFSCWYLQSFWVGPSSILATRLDRRTPWQPSVFSISRFSSSGAA